MGKEAIPERATPTATSTTATATKVQKGDTVFTMAQLAQHNTAQDCWICVRGTVYDVTSWVGKHPGGEDPLALNAGRDATQLFECYHESRHKKMLEAYKVGVLDVSEYPSFPEVSPFYDDLKKEVFGYFKERKMSIKHAPQMYVSTAALLCAVFGTWWLSIQYSSSVLGFAFAALSGIVSAFICFQPVHEGSHFATSSNPYIWRAMGSLLDFCNGGSFYIWCHQHFLGHHPFTNVTFGHNHKAADPDVLTNDPDIRRITPGQTWYKHYKLQHIYVPFVYCLLSIKYRINDITILYFTKMNGPVRVNPPSRYHETVFWAGKIFWFSYRIVATAVLTGSLLKALALYAVYDAALSYVLALVFQVNHVSTLAEWPTVDAKTNHVDMDWAKLQVRTTVDYSHGDAITTWLVGGLNYQTLHHLFPQISQVHAIPLGKIVRRVCDKHNVKFNYLPTYMAALNEHVTHLKNMGQAGELKVSELLDLN